MQLLESKLLLFVGIRAGGTGDELCCMGLLMSNHISKGSIKTEQIIMYIDLVIIITIHAIEHVLRLLRRIILSKHGYSCLTNE